MKTSTTSLLRPLQLRAMILRKFKSEGDVELAQQLVFNSNGIQRARDLAAEHASLAAQAVSHTSMQFSHIKRLHSQTLTACIPNFYPGVATLAGHGAPCIIIICHDDCHP